MYLTKTLDALKAILIKKYKKQQAGSIEEQR